MKKRWGRIGSCIMLMVSILVFTMLSGCTAKVGVQKVALEKRFENMYRTALTEDSLSERTLLFLRQRDLTEAWQKDPDTLLNRLHERVGKKTAPGNLFPLMELCFLRAGKVRKDSEKASALYLSCIYYAYTFLFGERNGAAPSPFDPHFRLAADFYNRAMAEHLLLFREGGMAFKREMRLPMLGSEVDFSPGRMEFPWDLDEIDRLHSAYEFEPIGVDDHIKSYGIGLPVIAERTPEALTAEGARDSFLPDVRQFYAATAVVRFLTDLGESDGGRRSIRAEYDLYDPMKTHEIGIGTGRVPLEVDFTVPLAYMVEKLTIPGGLKGLTDVAGFEKRSGLHMLEAFDPGKVPVVFVHGLMSTPVTWLSMFNNLLGDPVLRKNYQFWFFMYPTGNPIMYSASKLRESLKKVWKVYDPGGQNPSFNRMVLVGHSMGGLLSRLMISPGGDRIWNEIAETPLEEMPLTDEEKKLVHRIVYFDPLPFVSRSIFIATPHRGSKIAGGTIGRIGASLVKLPLTLYTRTVGRLMNEVQAGHLGLKMELDEMPTGIDGLKTDSAFVRVFGNSPMAQGVPFHSIIGNRKKGGTPGGSDGVVPYESAHLDGAVSEKIVQSGHSAHNHPLAIREVRRILMEHLKVPPSAEAGQD